MPDMATPVRTAALLAKVRRVMPRSCVLEVPYWLVFIVVSLTEQRRQYLYTWLPSALMTKGI